MGVNSFLRSWVVTLLFGCCRVSVMSRLEGLCVEICSGKCLFVSSSWGLTPCSRVVGLRDVPLGWMKSHWNFAMVIGLGAVDMLPGNVEHEVAGQYFLYQVNLYCEKLLLKDAMVKTQLLDKREKQDNAIMSFFHQYICIRHELRRKTHRDTTSFRATILRLR